jgi:hypothetical protein
MNRRSFLTFIGIGALGAIAAELAPAQPMLEPEHAIAHPPKDDPPLWWQEPTPRVWTKLTDPGHAHPVFIDGEWVSMPELANHPAWVAAVAR